MNYGLLPLCVDAMALGKVPFLDAGVQLDELQESIGSVGKVYNLFLNHHLQILLEMLQFANCINCAAIY